MIVLFAKLANADDWQEVEIFAKSNEDFLRQYIELENGIPSHDTMQRVMGSIAPGYMQGVYQKWNEIVNSNEGEALKKIICIDGKTMRSSKSKDQKAHHIVSAWCDMDGFCLGQKKVEEKSNEITAIPQLFIAYISLSDFFSVPFSGASFSDLSLCRVTAFFSASFSFMEILPVCFSSFDFSLFRTLLVFNILEQHEIWVTLSHPKYTKPMKGNKTDRKDAKWICDLYMCGMVKPSFIPPADIRELRDLVRYRFKLTCMVTGEKNRAQNCLTVSNLKLDDVFSDVFGKSSRSITEQILQHGGNVIRKSFSLYFVISQNDWIVGKFKSHGGIIK